MAIELATRDNGASEWESKLDLIKATVAKDHTDAELDMFLYQARKAGLDPLARQIYSIKRAGRAVIQTGIDGYRLLAARTGQYAGNDDAVFVDGERFPAAASVTVWRLVGGVRCPFSATARWEEYYPGEQVGQMWRKMPHTMLAKCAEGLALRKAFPAELSGVYTDAEMDQAETDSVRPLSTGGRTVDRATGEVLGMPPAPAARVCVDCDQAIGPYTDPAEGKTYSAAQVLRGAIRKYQAELCAACTLKRAAATKPAVDPRPNERAADAAF